MAKKVYQGRDTSTLVVVMEVAGPLMHSQVEGLEAPSIQIGGLPFVAGPSQSPMAEVLQPLGMVAS